jgi:hypothetical protein
MADENQNVNTQEEVAPEQELDLSQVNPALQSILSGEAAKDVKSRISNIEASDLIPGPAKAARDFALEQSGLVTPETVGNLELLQQRGLLTPEEVEQKRREMGILTPEMEAAEQARQEQVSPLLQGTPMAEAIPEGTNTVLRPTPDIIPEQTKEEIWAQKEKERKAAEAQAAKAKEDEAKRAEASAANEAEKNLRAQAAAAKQNQESVAKAEQEVAQDTKVAAAEESKEGGVLNQASPLLKKVRFVIAVLLGGISQGLTGAKTNPALDYLNNEFEKELENRKLDEKKKSDIRRAMVEQMQLMMQQKEYLLKTADQRLKFEKHRLELKQYDDVEKQKAVLHNLVTSGGGLSEDQVAQLSLDHPKIAERTVRIPDSDRFVLVSSRQQAEAIKNEAAGLVNAEQDLGELLQLVDHFGNNPAIKVEDRTAVRRAGTLQQAVIGNLRILLFGPGVITDNERAIAERIIPDPSDVFTLASANRAALETMKDKVKFAMRDRVRAAGGRLPLTPNEANTKKLMNLYMKEKPKLHKVEAMSRAVDTLKTTKRWE